MTEPKIHFTLCRMPRLQTADNPRVINAFVYADDIGDDTNFRASNGAITIINAICDTEPDDPPEFARLIHRCPPPEGAVPAWEFVIAFRSTRFGLVLSHSYGLPEGGTWDALCANVGRDLFDYIWGRCAAINRETRRVTKLHTKGKRK